MSANLDSTLGKLEVTNAIGEQLDRQLEQAGHKAQQMFGGASAFNIGAKKVGALGEHVDQDLKEGKLQVGTELEVSSLIKKYIIRASDLLQNLAEKSKSEELVAHGREAAVRESMEVVKRHCVSAKARAQQLVASAEGKAEHPDKVPDERTEGPREAGDHPGPSTLRERREEAAKTKAAEEAKAEEAKAAEEAKSPDDVAATASGSSETKATPKKKIAKKGVAKKGAVKKKAADPKPKPDPKPEAAGMPWEGPDEG